MRVFVEPLLLWKGDTATAASTSGDADAPVPEGSVASPSLGTIRDQSSDVTVRHSNVATRQDVYAIPNGVDREVGVSRRSALWNNQYAALMDDYE